MYSEKFKEGVRNGMRTAREYTHAVEGATDNGDMRAVLEHMATLVGHILNAQAVLAAKVAYELSKAEDKGVEQ